MQVPVHKLSDCVGMLPVYSAALMGVTEFQISVEFPNMPASPGAGTQIQLIRPHYIESAAALVCVNACGVWSHTAGARAQKVTNFEQMCSTAAATAAADDVPHTKKH